MVVCFLLNALKKKARFGVYELDWNSTKIAMASFPYTRLIHGSSHTLAISGQHIVVFDNK